MHAFLTVFKPMHPEGWRFLLAFGAVTFFAFWLWPPLGWLGLLLTFWVYFFFRDPARAVPQGAGLILSPADGMVTAISPAVPPPELGLGPAPRLRISVFMNVFNCHVNRFPASGSVKTVAYRPGRFLNASLDKASEDNERNGLLITLPDGRELAVVQIAGLIARRILCFVEAGATAEAGQRFGLIRFGSRLDVYLPEGLVPEVALGQTAIAGETVLARLGYDGAPAQAVLI